VNSAIPVTLKATVNFKMKVLFYKKCNVYTPEKNNCMILDFLLFGTCCLHSLLQLNPSHLKQQITYWASTKQMKKSEEALKSILLKKKKSKRFYLLLSTALFGSNFGQFHQWRKYCSSRLNFTLKYEGNFYYNTRHNASSTMNEYFS
jgi:hypothetical protein